MSFLQGILTQAKLASEYTPKGCYVYIGMIGDDVGYVGKGSRDRYKHLTTSNSQITNVAKAKAEGAVFTVYILCDWLTHQDALYLEKSAIRALNPILNREHSVEAWRQQAHA